MTGYRALTVETVTDTGSDVLTIRFHGSIAQFEMRKDFLAEKGLSDIAQGQTILIKGRRGNADIALWGCDTVEDIRPA